ncbi:MAG: hypothetical protein KAW45_05420 [Thermoplasmatales archaeon]|nr:hypothetical protein [Thermoplasmatales archaeon]
MINSLYRKGLVFAIILILIGMNAVFLTRGSITNKLSQTLTPRKFYVPKIVEPGDLVFCDNKLLTRYQKKIIERFPGYADDHGLMYAGNNRFIESSAIFPWIYYGSKGWDLCKIGVVNTGIFYLNLWATNIIYGKVKNASSSQKYNALNWAKKQLGQPYQFGYRQNWPYHKHQWWMCPNTNGTTYNPDTGTFFKEEYYDYWICTEIIWAAYKHCEGDSGIDIEATWHYDKYDDSWHWYIGPDEMLGNVDQIYLYTDGDYGYPGSNEPLVETAHVNIEKNNVTIYGMLIDDGGERCHCYVNIIGERNRYCGFFKSESIETFSYTFLRLKPGTYQWYAWAYNSLGKAQGEIKSFTIL